MRALLLVQWLAMASPSSPSHDVERGQSLWRIAAAHGCTVADLRAANPRLVEPLQAGVKLALPSKARRVAKAPPKKKAAPQAEAPEPAKPKVARTHRVIAGDTLGGIALRHDTTVAELQRTNRLRGSMIVLGQVLVLDDVAPISIESAGEGPLPTPPTERFDLPPPPKADTGGESRGGGRKPAPAPALVGAVQLPRDRAYYLRSPKRAWGLPHVVESTRAAVIAVKKKHPKVHRLAIGDISSERGGRLSGHKSHRGGRDVDVGLYFRRSPSSYPQRFVGAKSAPLDYAATWALIEAFFEQSKRAGGPVQIFLDYEVQGQIHDWARKHGVSRRVLREVFQYPHGRWAHRGLVRHEPAHDDHLHVRFGCPKGVRCS